MKFDQQIRVTVLGLFAFHIRAKQAEALHNDLNTGVGFKTEYTRCFGILESNVTLVFNAEISVYPIFETL